MQEREGKTKLSKKKIAIVSTGFAPIPAVNGGGVETLSTILLLENQNENLDFDVYTIYDSKLDDYKIKNTRLKIVYASKCELLIKLYYRVINRVFKTLHINYSFGEFDKRISKEVLKNNYDIIVIENNMNIFRQIAKKNKSSKLVYHIHNSIENDPSKNPVWTRIVVNRAFKILAVSNYIQSQFLNFNAKQSTVFYNCADPNIFYEIENKDSIREKYGISKDEFVVLYCGRLSKEKGAGKLYQALRIAVAKGRPFKLLVAGESWFNSFAEKKFKEELSKISKGIESQIIKLGYVNNADMKNIYSIANLTVVPSLCDEAFGLTALESLLCGTPVIASKKGGLPEVVDLSVGFTIEVDSQFPEHIEECIHKLSEDHILYLNMKNNCRKYAIDKFGDTRDYYEHFKELIG